MSQLYSDKPTSFKDSTEAQIWRKIEEWHDNDNGGILVKVEYIDMAGSVAGGLLLSQIVYWHTGSCVGETRLRLATRDGRYWLCKSYAQWWKEIRITEKQVRLAMDKMVANGILETAIIKYNGTPYRQCRILPEGFWRQLCAVANKPPTSRECPQRTHGAFS